MRKILLVLAAVLGLSVAALPASQAQSPVAGTPKAVALVALPAFAVADPASVPVLDRTARVNARTAGTSKLANPKIVMPPASLKPKLIGSGHHPYGGETFSDRRLDGAFGGCSTAVATRSASGAQYVYIAGHCVLNESNGTPDVDPTTGQFWSPYNGSAGCAFTCAPKFGANGYGGYTFGTGGDHAFVRAGIAPTLYREIQHYDGTVFTATGTGNPVQNETGSCACGFSHKIIHGFVSFACFRTAQCTDVVGGRTVGNLALMQVNLAAEGCPIPGDSGSPILGGHDVIGTATAVSHDATNCYIYFSRAGNDMQPVGQFLAPAPPA